MSDPRIRLGTRGSPLALAQARMVATAIEVAHNWPADSVGLVPLKTSGDRIQDRPLAEVGGKALWTKELDAALLAGEIDASVHSMKDVESERPKALIIAAMLARADVRDRLIGARSLDELAEGAVVGTSSPRRAAQLLRSRPDLKIISIRGNVDTRLEKCAAGEVAATILAAAGLHRLGKRSVGVPLKIADMLPAPAQGAIGIECRRDDDRVGALLDGINHRETFDAVCAERAFTGALGGSCHSPVAALAVVEKGAMRLRVQILSEDGANEIHDDAVFPCGDFDGPAALGRAMLARAPDSIRRLFDPA